jgi:hypothetical protein
MIYVKNVGDLPVSFSRNGAVSLDGVFVAYSISIDNLAVEESVVFTLSNTINAGAHTIKVTSVDGTFSQISRTFS